MNKSLKKSNKRHHYMCKILEIPRQLISILKANEVLPAA